MSLRSLQPSDDVFRALMRKLKIMYDIRSVAQLGAAERAPLLVLHLIIT